MMKAMEEAFALSMFQALRRLQQGCEVHAKRLSRLGGLTPLQLLVLQVLLAEREITATGLAKRVSLSQAALSGVLDRLESRGLLARRRDETDRRKQWLLLEDAGRAVLQAAPALLPDYVMVRFAELPEWERHAVLAGLLRAAELFERPEDEE